MASPHSTRHGASRPRSSLVQLLLLLLGAAALIAVALAGTATGAPAPGPRPDADPTATAEPTPSPGSTATDEPTPSPTPTPTATPIVVRAGSGLNAQFGYTPPFTRNVPAFDAAGNAYIRSRSADPDYTGFVNVWRDGAWRRLDITAALRAAYPDFGGTEGGGGGPTARVVFDTQDRAYTVVTVRLRGDGVRNVLLWSDDHCGTWHAADLPDGEIVPESWTGHNAFDGPPPLLIGRTAAAVSPDTGKLVRELWFTRPVLSGDTVVVPQPIQVSARALSLGDGATTASPLATHGDTTWIAYVETTARPGQGSPVFVAPFDRSSGALGKPVLLAWSQPGNDGHAQPGIALDSLGYLHLIAGAHGRPFQYRRSLVPYSTYDGWSQLEKVCTTGYRERASGPQEGRQTYLSYVVDAQDRLHIVYRQWRKDCETTFGGHMYGALSYQRRDPFAGWTQPQIVVVPPYPEYSIYTQALTLDRGGRLFLSASCVAGDEGSTRKAAVERWKQSGRDGPQPPLYLRRMVLVSANGGGDWRFADTADFTPGDAP
jgi:hypothetical protein